MRRSPLTAAAVLLVLVVSGCTDDPEPKRADPTSEPPPPSSPPTARPTTEPSLEDVRAFVRRWQTALDEMQNSGEPGPFLELTSNCQSCDSIADLVTSYYDAGGYVKFEGTQILAIEETGRKAGFRQFDIERRLGPTEYVTARGEPVERTDGGRDRIRMSVIRKGDRWIVTRYARLV